MLYQLLSVVLFALTAGTIGTLVLKVPVKISSDKMLINK
jgi:hypothetical protein